MRHSTAIPVILCSALGWAFTSHALENRGLKVVVRDQSGQQVCLYEHSHALLIGVSDYTAGWPDLVNVKKDITRVKAALEKHGFQVSEVIDPTRAQL